MLLAASQSAWLRAQATRRSFVRRAVSRFMPGETLDDALRAAETLKPNGLSTIVTHLGENVTDRSEADANVEHYFMVIDRIRAAGLDAEVSVKPTQLGLDLDPQLAHHNTCRIAEKAKASGNAKLWIDMEGTPYVDATLEIYRRLRASDANVGVCLQAYLYRTKADIEEIVKLGGSIRLVKGAYNEPPSMAYPKKNDVDAQFCALAERLLAPDVRAANVDITFGTHDPELIRKIESHANTNGVSKRGFEFAMLYGIRSEDQVRLARAGYRSRVLISYGEFWFPWYMRRLAERPANLWFIVKNVFGG